MSHNTLIAPKQAWVSKGVFRGFTEGRLIQVESEYPQQGEWRRFRCRYPSGEGIAHVVLDEVEILQNFRPFNPMGFTATLKDGRTVEVVPKPQNVFMPKGGDA